METLRSGRVVAVPVRRASEEGIDTMSGLGSALRSKTMSCVEATQHYLDHIDERDQRLVDGLALNSVLEQNPDSLAIARRLDREAKSNTWRGPLHGIPILVKDNIDTGDRMHTTAGSLAMKKVRARSDAFIVSQLRAAGAVIIGKTNLSEWANFRGERSMSGWSSLGGQTRNPYDRRRSPSGSSSGSGVAVAADFCVGAIGTETDGSVTSPASVNGIVGFKPTVGLLSRSGIIPIAHSQDTAGPMTKTVRDAALLLAAMAGIDRHDPATKRNLSDRKITYELSAEALSGARVGVAPSVIGSHPATTRLFHQALDDMRAGGAVIVVDVGLGQIDQVTETELVVLWHELKADLNAYLRTAGPHAPPNLSALIEFNAAHAETVLSHFGQEHFEKAQACKSLQRSTEYMNALARNDRLTRVAIERAMKKHRLDALVAPTGTPAWLTDSVNGDASNDTTLTTTIAAVAGFPHLTVPMGFVAHLPVGISFIGRAWSDELVLNLGYSFEQHTHHRRKPSTTT
jgi:amidase